LSIPPGKREKERKSALVSFRPVEGGEKKPVPQQGERGRGEKPTAPYRLESRGEKKNSVAGEEGVRNGCLRGTNEEKGRRGGGSLLLLFLLRLLILRREARIARSRQKGGKEGSLIYILFSPSEDRRKGK